MNARIASKLKHLRENVRHMSPEELADKIAQLGGEVSASYIRRVEKREHNPTVDKLQWIIEGLGLNLGLFFEDFIDETSDVAAKERRYHSILQRGLESPYRSELIAVMKFVEKTLSNPDVPEGS